MGSRVAFVAVVLVVAARASTAHLSAWPFLSPPSCLCVSCESRVTESRRPKTLYFHRGMVGPLSLVEEKGGTWGRARERFPSSLFFPTALCGVESTHVGTMYLCCTYQLCRRRRFQCQSRAFENLPNQFAKQNLAYNFGKKGRY